MLLEQVKVILGPGAFELPKPCERADANVPGNGHKHEQDWLESVTEDDLSLISPCWPSAAN